MATTLYKLIIKCRLAEIRLKRKWKSETDCINTRQENDDDDETTVWLWQTVRVDDKVKM